MKTLWKVLPKIPHGNLETMLNRIQKEDWEVRELLPAGQSGDEPLVTVVAAKTVSAADQGAWD